MRRFQSGATPGAPENLGCLFGAAPALEPEHCWPIPGLLNNYPAGLAAVDDGHGRSHAVLAAPSVPALYLTDETGTWGVSSLSTPTAVPVERIDRGSVRLLVDGEGALHLLLAEAGARAGEAGGLRHWTRACTGPEAP